MLKQLPNNPDRMLLVAKFSGRPAFLQWNEEDYHTEWKLSENKFFKWLIPVYNLLFLQISFGVFVIVMLSLRTTIKQAVD